MEYACKVLKAVSEPTRIRIIKLLSSANIPLCGYEFVEALQEPHYNLSRHLKTLKNAGLVKERKEGKWVYHFLKENKGDFYFFLMKSISSVKDLSGIFGEDYRRLSEILDKKKVKKNLVI